MVNSVTLWDGRRGSTVNTATYNLYIWIELGMPCNVDIKCQIYFDWINGKIYLLWNETLNVYNLASNQWIFPRTEQVFQ